MAAIADAETKVHRESAAAASARAQRKMAHEDPLWVVLLAKIPAPEDNATEHDQTHCAHASNLRESEDATTFP